MNFKKSIIILFLLIFIFSICSVSASENFNDTFTQDNSFMESYSFEELSNEKFIESTSSQKTLTETNCDEEIIEVNDWQELQYYCSLSDKDYTLKLKENTNFYPTNLKDNNQQIIIKNNVKIIGSCGAYFGDNSSNEIYWDKGIAYGRYISYNPIIVPDNSKIGITLENITFKWIYVINYKPDAIFIQMGGNTNNFLKNCVFENNRMEGGAFLSCLS